jgi:hypothetical protein
MSPIETAQAIYEEETQGEKSVSQLANALEQRADKLAQQDVATEQATMRDDVRTEIAGTLEGADSKDGATEAKKLDEAAADLRSSLGEHDPVMKDLPGDTAGQAQLQSSNMWVDAQAIRSGTGDRLINTEIAEDIGAHEARHQEQSATADAETITVKGKELNATKLREFDAMEEQSSTDFLSAEYKAIRAEVGSVLSGSDRELIKNGQFRELERRHAGADQALAA